MPAAYDRAAKYYDALNWYRDYDAQVSILDDLFSSLRAKKVRKVIDLGCGTGTHAMGLARLGYEVHALDVSAEMIRIGKAKSASEGVQVRFLRASLPSLSVRGRFDAMYSLFSVTNMLNPDSLKALFHNVRTHLIPGGIFVFDFWTPLSGEYYPMSWIWARMRDKKILRLTEMTYDKGRQVEKLTRRHLVFDRKRLTDDFKERLEFRLYTSDEVASLSRETGFKITKQFEGTMQSYNLNDPSESAMIILMVAERD